MEVVATLFGPLHLGHAWCSLNGLVMCLGSEGPEFKSRLAVELIPGGVDSACHPSDVGKIEYQLAEMIEPFEYLASEWRLVQDCVQ